MGLQRYRAVLRAPGVARLLALALIARAPNGMSSLALLLLVSPRQGYARAGVVVGVYVAVTGLSAPVAARLVDRYGARPVLIATSAAYLVAMLALAGVPASSYAGLLAGGVAAGLTQPPIVAVVRGLWARIVEPDQVQVLYGLEATAQELVFIVGPALVALLAAVTDARVAVAATGVLGFVGTVGVASAPPVRGAVARGSARRERLLGARLVVLVGVATTATFCFSMADIGVIAFMSGRHADAKAGIALALWSAGSMVGGVLIGARVRRSGEAAVAVGMLAVAASIALLAAAPDRVVLVVLLFAGGTTIAPALSLLYARVAASVPEAGSTEAFAWLGVGFLVGSSLGASAGGFTVDGWGSRPTFLLAGVLPALFSTALLLHARRGEPPAAASPVAPVEREPLAS